MTFLRPKHSDQKPFRSHGETQIGRCLDRAGIPYRYEHPLAVLDRGKLRLWYPDIQLPQYGLLIEYFGRADDPAYQAGMTRKQIVYEDNDLTALFITPEFFRGDWPRKLLDLIENTLVDRLTNYRQRHNDGAAASPCV